jgi:hypothetical protein
MSRKAGTNKARVKCFFEIRGAPLSFADVPHGIEVTHLFNWLEIASFAIIGT